MKAIPANVNRGDACIHPPPVQLLHDLISAFKQDVVVTRYATWEDLLDYCRRSANPVGRLVLRIAGRDRPELDAASDAVCTALQLTNFWQDLEIDWAKGRLYVPASIWRAAGAREADLDVRSMTPEWRKALGDAGTRTRALFESVRRGASFDTDVRERLRGRADFEPAGTTVEVADAREIEKVYVNAITSKRRVRGPARSPSCRSVR